MPATATLAAPIDWAARRAERHQQLLDSFNPVVPGLPGDGSGVVLHRDTTRGLTYTWYNLSRRPQDFQSLTGGHIVSRLAVTYRTEAGEDIEVAYLNVTHSTKELLASLPSIFHWAEENSAASFGLGMAAEDGRTVSDERIWAGGYTHLDVEPPSMRGQRHWGTFSESQAPTDPTVLAQEIEFLAATFRKQQRGFLRCLSTPFVDYSHVDSEREALRTPGHPGNLRGTGIGRSMYLLAAQHLASMGKILRASGLQSQDAEGLWQRLVADPEIPTRRTQVTWYRSVAKRTTTYWCLDYTKHGA